jgi:hypothetical protein
MDEPEHPAETEPPGAIEAPPVGECPLSKAATESATTLLLLLS